MAISKYILAVLFLSFGHLLCFSQEEVPPDACNTAIKTGGIDSAGKARIIELVAAADTYLCRSLEEKSGFARITDSLMNLTTLQEKQDLFNSGSAILKFRLFTVILRENDSLGLELLKRSIKDTAALSVFCSCTFDEVDLNLSLVNYYYFFIQLKYQLGVAGAVGGQVVWFPPYSKRPDKKKWRMKLYELKGLVRTNVDISRLKVYYPGTCKELLD